MSINRFTTGLAKFQVIKFFCLVEMVMIYENTYKTNMFKNIMHVILNSYFLPVTLPIATKCHVKVFSGALFTNWTTNLVGKTLGLSLKP